MEFENLSIIHGTKFGTVQPMISLEDMKNNGLDFGDSLNIYFSNGNKLLDIPYFNGFYVRTTEPLVCGYPGYEHPAIGKNNGGDIWEIFNLDESMTVSIELCEKAKYLNVQNTMDTVYTNFREDYASDEIFANYRAMKGGNLKDNWFYRSASPCDNQYFRAKYTNKLMEKDKVNFILNISDCEEEIEIYRLSSSFNYPYFDEIYNSGRIALLNLSADYRSSVYMKILASGLKILTQFDGPYLTHCTEGKDRTGFVALLIESLLGATYEEMKNDYMTTYFNYYGITRENNPEKYDAIVDLKFDDMAMYLAEVESNDELHNADFFMGARRYLIKGGMNDEEINVLIHRLHK